MKLFLLIALIAVVYAPGYVQAGICSNSFLKSLQQSGVKLYPVVHKGRFNHCQSEWNTFGTCCNPVSLVHSFKLEKRKTAGSSAAMKSIIARIEGFLTQTINSLVKIKHPVATPAFIAIQNLVAEVNRFQAESLFKTFNSASDTCWEQMSKIRGSALCSICSGRSNNFFKSSKALVDLGDCRRVVDSCQTFFVDMNKFFFGLDKLKAKLKGFAQTHQTGKELEQFEGSLKKFELPKHLMATFLLYAHSRNQAVKNKAASTICANILNIRKKTYVDSVAKVFDQAKEKLTKIFNEAKDKIIDGVKKMKEIGSIIGNGINTGFNKAKDFASKSAGKTKAAFKSAASKTKAFASKSAGKTKAAFKSAASKAKSGLKKAAKKFKKFFRFRMLNWNNNHVLTLSSSNMFESDSLTVSIGHNSHFPGIGEFVSNLGDVHARPMNLSLAFP